MWLNGRSNPCSGNLNEQVPAITDLKESGDKSTELNKENPVFDTSNKKCNRSTWKGVYHSRADAQKKLLERHYAQTRRMSSRSHTRKQRCALNVWGWSNGMCRASRRAESIVCSASWKGHFQWGWVFQQKWMTQRDGRSNQEMGWAALLKEFGP